MDAIITLRKQETCQVIIRNVPDDHRRPLSEWLELAMSARGKDWEEDDIEVDSFEIINPGSDGLADVDFRPVNQQKTCLDCNGPVEGVTELCDACHDERDRIDEIEKANG